MHKSNTAVNESSKMKDKEVRNGGMFDKDRRKSSLFQELPDFQEERPIAYAGSVAVSL